MAMSFFSRPPPLGNARTVPALVPKRSASGPLPIAKRVKVAATKPKPTAPFRALTPDPSDPVDASSDMDAPMHPAMNRVRAPPTPTTSTVAASSSPQRRLALSSSPRSGGYRSKSRTTTPPVPVLLDHSTTLVFGRHRHQPKGIAPAPDVLLPRLLNVTNPTRTISLDRAARHASRVHAAVELVPTAWGSVVRLIVLGQNGVRVRHGAEARRRLRCGTITEFTAEECLEVDFYGAAVVIRAEAEQIQERDARERLFTPEPKTPVNQMSNLPTRSPISLPPSSPPMPMDNFAPMDSEIEMEDADEHETESLAQQLASRLEEKLEVVSAASLTELLPALEPVPVNAPTPGADAEDTFSRESSPLSDIGDEDMDPVVALPTFIPGSAPTPGAVRLSSPVVPASPCAVPAAPAPSRAGTPARPLISKSRAATPPHEIPPFPSALDLPALLATTVVFSGSSKLSLPEIIKSLLETQPALRDHADDKVWSAWAAIELDSNKMFGKVARNGKDVSGRPLLPHYFYIPAEDPDAARAKELGVLVRPLRAAQRTGGKVIDWRPVGAGRRRY